MSHKPYSAFFEHIGSIQLTREEASSGAHSGKCDEDIAALRKFPHIAEQLNAIDADCLRIELREYGAWDDNELSDHDENLSRILWLACGYVNDAYNESEDDDD